MKPSEFILETDMIKRMGFGAKGYNVGASLKSAFAEFHPKALDSYAEQIQNSNADLQVKDNALKLLNSIKSKSEDIETLLGDFNFDDNSAVGAELYRKLSGDTDPGEEDTLRFYDFNIDASLKSGMFENVVGLLDELDSLFYLLTGMLGASGDQKPEPKSIGFRQSIKEKYRKKIKSYIKELYKNPPTLTEQPVNYRMILRKCSHGTDGTPYSTVGNQTCNVYPYLVYNQSVSGNVPFQIGECFAWNHDVVGNGNGIVCVVDYTTQPVSSAATLHRDQHTCQDCGQDANNNGVSDCIDCDGIIWNQRFKCHPIHGCIPCQGSPCSPTAFPFTSYNSCQNNCSPPIYGCTDPNATNYDPNATQDDGSCVFPIYGCMDQNACNFDSNADTDDGSCTYPGCTDPNASNYNPNAGCDDGSCIHEVDPHLTVDDTNLTVTSHTDCPPSHPWHQWPLGYNTNNDPMANITYANQSSYCEWCADWKNAGSVPGTFDSRAWGFGGEACDCCPPDSTLTLDPPNKPKDPDSEDDPNVDMVERLQKLANISQK